MPQQNYEDYWKLTLEYTDFNGTPFRETLNMIVNFIDEFKGVLTKENYHTLQTRINKKFSKVDMGSVRKSINQFVKLGFVNNQLKSYPKDTKNFLSAKTNRKRQSVFSKIVYSYSSFNSSVKNYSSQKEINFLIKTLVENGKLTKEEIIALMLVDISKIKKGFLTKTEIRYYLNKAVEINFIKRKYNQVGYLFGLLGKLDDIVFVNNELYFTEDAKQIFGENLEISTRKRDQYLHLLFKNQLKEETIFIYKNEKCMVEKISYPVLIASHIKPFILSDDDEAYDVNNGFLLSRNIDSLFDLGYITFDNKGEIIFSKKLSEDVVSAISKYSLDKIFLNTKRLEYLSYHRKNVYEKRFSSSE